MMVSQHHAGYTSGTSPAAMSSKRRITYKESTWKVYRFEIWSVEFVCQVIVLKVEGALFVWIGGSSSEPQLNELALGVPAREESGGLATALLGADGSCTAMARRLAARLQRPVYVSSGCAFDRFNMPLIEQGLIMEIKNKPELFNL